MTHKKKMEFFKVHLSILYIVVIPFLFCFVTVSMKKYKIKAHFLG